MKKIIGLGIVIVLVVAGFFVYEMIKNRKEDSHHFTYQNQSDWEFVSGKMQSPINIDTKKLVKSATEANHPEFDYESSHVVENNGHTLEVEGEGHARLNGRDFVLQQVHFHVTSEHTIDGKHEAMEAHFVHQAQDGRLAVVAVMMTLGQTNPVFDQILKNVDKHVDQSIAVEQLLPNNRVAMYHYLGSLTTPPLTENVEWYIMKEFVQISKAQLLAFEQYYDDNNRDIQPLNGRQVIDFE